jgi:GT2 family glycosyltransferase
VETSVVIITRDRPDRLRLVLRALNTQCHLPGGMEVVVVDDASRQNMAPMLEGHDHLDIRLIRQTPQEHIKRGYVGARNVGLSAASGEVVLCLDDDVLFGPDLVAAHLAVHASDPRALVVGDRYNTFFANLQSERSRAAVRAALAGDWRALERQSRRDYYSRQTLKLFDQDSGGLPAPWLNCVGRNVSFRAADAAAVGNFDEGFTQWGADDIEFGLRMHKAGVRYHYRSQARVYHLETPLPPGKIDALRSSLRYFAAKHPGLEPRLFEEFVFGLLSLEELCASVRAGERTQFSDRETLTFFRTQR